MAAAKRVRKKDGSGVQGPVLGDFIVSWAWVFVSSVFAEIADYLKPVTGLDDFTLNTAVLILALIAFAPICNQCWGAIFNPVNSLALIASGKGNSGQNVARMGAQLAGAFLGSYTAKIGVPARLQGKFPSLAAGLRAGVSVRQGAACEAVLGAAMNGMFLMSLGARNKTLAFWTPLAATVVMCYVGAAFTGPSMNPSLAFSWNWHYQQHSLVEHLVVFWAAPVAGALAAGIAFRVLHSQKKQKKQKKVATRGSGATAKATAPTPAPVRGARKGTGQPKQRDADSEHQPVANGSKAVSRSASPAAKRSSKHTIPAAPARKGSDSDVEGVPGKQVARKRPAARTRAQ